jgi:hypothetical protein
LRLPVPPEPNRCYFPIFLKHLEIMLKKGKETTQIDPAQEVCVDRVLPTDALMLPADKLIQLLMSKQIDLSSVS